MSANLREHRLHAQAGDALKSIEVETTDALLRRLRRVMTGPGSSQRRVTRRKWELVEFGNEDANAIFMLFKET